MENSPIQNLQKYLESGIDIARTVGKEIKDAFYKTKTTETKAHASDLVTVTDRLVEKIIISTLKEKYPTHSFIGEESTAAAGKQSELTDNPTWIIDPIDGTTNFVHSFMHTVVSIALAIKKEPVVGIVYNPILDNMYTAIKGGGAFCNGQRIHVSGQENIGSSLISFAVKSANEKEIDNDLTTLRALLTAGVHGVRNTGSAANHLCFVAAGSNDAFITYGIYSWDIAAGVLLVEEAGGVVMDPINGGPTDVTTGRVLAVSSRKLASSILPLITIDSA